LLDIPKGLSLLGKWKLTEQVNFCTDQLISKYFDQI